LNHSSLRQLVVGLVALPLSALPFLAYLTFTPEGRLVRDKVRVAVSPPTLPSLNPWHQLEAAQAVPHYEGGVMALVYHGVGSSSDAEGGYVVSPSRFGEHLASLRAARMNVVTAADIAWSMAVDSPLPERAVMLSFDDGRTDAMLWADPLLQQAGMKATMFVISQAAAEPGLYYAGWDRLRAAARSGRWDIQAHTDSAHHLQRVAGGKELPALTSLAPGETLDGYRQRIHDDLERNSDAIQAHVGHRPVAFAYPFGAHGTERTNDPGIEAILREEVARRFVLAFHQDDQDTVPLAGPAQPRIGLRRMTVGDWTGNQLLHRIAEAVAATPGTPPAASTASDPATAPLPGVPFLDELRRRPRPSSPSPSLLASAPGPAVTTTSPPPLPPATGALPTTGTGGAAPSTGPANPTTAEPPLRTTTTTTSPSRSTTTTGPPATTTTTTTAGPPATTTTTDSCHDNRDRCKR
jgi:peptidoglycan/xylan/chitin deacetylase (PgdA/CDA1 family)